MCNSASATMPDASKTLDTMLSTVHHSFTIGAISGKAKALLAHAPPRKGNRDCATGSRDQKGFLLSGVRSRSGNESCACMGTPEEYTGPAVHPAGEPTRPTQWGPEQAPCTSGDRKHGGERTLPREGDDVGVLMVRRHDLGAPPFGLGRVSYWFNPGSGRNALHENSTVASAYLQSINTVA